MGYQPWNAPTRAEVRAAAIERKRVADNEKAAATAKRMALADKIVLTIVDRVSADIIRPGPKPEERECYVMAAELREHSAHLKDLVAAILAIEAEEIAKPRTPEGTES